MTPVNLLSREMTGYYETPRSEIAALRESCTFLHNGLNNTEPAREAIRRAAAEQRADFEAYKAANSATVAALQLQMAQLQKTVGAIATDYATRADVDVRFGNQDETLMQLAAAQQGLQAGMQACQRAQKQLVDRVCTWMLSVAQMGAQWSEQVRNTWAGPATELAVALDDIKGRLVGTLPAARQPVNLAELATTRPEVNEILADLEDKGAVPRDIESALNAVTTHADWEAFPGQVAVMSTCQA